MRMFEITTESVYHAALSNRRTSILIKEVTAPSTDIPRSLSVIKCGNPPSMCGAHEATIHIVDSKSIEYFEPLRTHEGRKKMYTKIESPKCKSLEEYLRSFGSTDPNLEEVLQRWVCNELSIWVYNPLAPKRPWRGIHWY